MTHRIVIVGGGAGGLELATRLGRTLGKRKRASIVLVDANLTHIWKPLLHEVAAGSLNSSEDELNYVAQGKWNHFEFQLGRMSGLDRARKTIRLAATLDEDGGELEEAAEISRRDLSGVERKRPRPQKRKRRTRGVTRRPLKLTKRDRECAKAHPSRSASAGVRPRAYHALRSDGDDVPRARVLELTHTRGLIICTRTRRFITRRGRAEAGAGAEGGGGGEPSRAQRKSRSGSGFATCSRLHCYSTQVHSSRSPPSRPSGSEPDLSEF